jgi:hypothetical protein
MVHAVMRAWRHGEVACAAGKECGKMVCAGVRIQQGGTQL